LFILAPVLALAGCQKSGDSSQPAAAVNGPDGEKAETHGPAATETPPVKPAEDLLHPTYEVETSQGKFSVRLDGEKAPLTVENFRNYVNCGHYNLTIFHQVFIKDGLKIVLGGGYTADLKEKAARTPIRNEAHNGLKNHRGTIAMARRQDDEDSATCQFFINVADNNSLNFKAPTAKDYGYCVFGEVTDGMEVLDRIAKTPVHDIDKLVAVPVETVVIKSIRQVK
jgi:cyclophilin family peptidyl-prolyl cis-trans isomerase